jgi:hypothetical protein
MRGLVDYTEYLACRILEGCDDPGLVIEMKVVGLVLFRSKA